MLLMCVFGTFFNRSSDAFMQCQIKKEDLLTFIIKISYAINYLFIVFNTM